MSGRMTGGRAASEHDRAWEQIPWLVNGTLQGQPLDELRQHLVKCELCRAELSLQTQLREVVAAQPTVEFAPQSSFNKLQARIDSDAKFDEANAGTDRPRRRWLWWGVAAQWLVMALGAWWYVQFTAADYRTVTSPATTPVGELKVVFDRATTVAEIDALLQETGLSTVAGPSPAGVFVLRRDAEHQDKDLDGLVAHLHANPRVRFAERSTTGE